MKTLTKLYEAAQQKFTDFEYKISKQSDALANQTFTKEEIQSTPKDAIFHSTYETMVKLSKKSKAEKDAIDKWQTSMIEKYGLKVKALNESEIQPKTHDVEAIKIGDKITAHKMTMVIKKISNSTFIGNRIDPKTGEETKDELRMDKSMFTNNHYKNGIVVTPA